MRIRVFFLVVLAAAVGGGILLYSLRSETAASSAAVDKAVKTVPVTVATVVQKAEPVEIATVGRVQALASVAIRSRIDGVISEVAVADGQEVKAGDELFRLDDREEQAALKQAEANLAKDQAQGASAKRQVDRLTPLAAKDFTTRQDYDTATTTVQTLQATIAADQAAIDTAKIALSYTIIRAPIAGRVGTVAFKLGSSVRAADAAALVTINQLQPILVAFSVSQGDMGELQSAMASGPVAVSVHMPDSSAPPQQGTVSYIENAIDPTSNTLSVKAQFPNASEFLWPSQFVNVTMTVRVEPNAIVVPAAAVQINQDGSYVWMVKPDKTVQMQSVKVSRQLGDQTVIEGSVKAGDLLVTEGQLRLEPGARVDFAAPVVAVESGQKSEPGATPNATMGTTVRIDP